MKFLQLLLKNVGTLNLAVGNDLQFNGEYIRFYHRFQPLSAILSGSNSFIVDNFIVDACSSVQRKSIYTHDQANVFISFYPFGRLEAIFCRSCTKITFTG